MKLTDDLKKSAGVYVLTNMINGKIYVGESVDIKKRLPRYLKEKTQIVSKAIDKYGVENFQLYVEYLPDFTKDDLIEFERQLIIQFNSLVPNGYNVCVEGTNGTGRKHSQETKDKIGKAHKGKIVSQATRDKFSKARKGKKQNKGPNHGQDKNKAILQIDKDTNEVIKEWESIKSATLSLAEGKSRSGDISRAIKGVRLKSAFGFKWKFK